MSIEKMVEMTSEDQMFGEMRSRIEFDDISIVRRDSVNDLIFVTESNKKVKTFSIGYDENEYNEGQYAKIVSKHCNTDHRQIKILKQDNSASEFYKSVFKNSI